jgi:predicted mannosyl-3-phosphoglycerate phosphatase (HAD superfamily)
VLAGYVVFTDIDHTMLGSNADATGISFAVERFEVNNIPVIPVTAKSIYEILAVRDLLGLWRHERIIAIAESGAAVYAHRDVLPYADGEVSVNGERLEYVKLYPDNIDLSTISSAAMKAFSLAKCREPPIDVSRMDGRKLSEITGLPVHLASLIPLHDHMKIYFSRDSECKLRVKEILESMGFYVGLGRNFIHVGAHRGKGYAVRWALENIPELFYRSSIAFGDSLPDRDMLELADIPIVIPPEEGAPLRLRRCDYLIAPCPPPCGWVTASTILVLNIL